MSNQLTEKAARLIAFYLPQYHPIPENDEWWGPGFTEWTNTAKAKPLFKGHFQPRLPADLGYYDLRVPEVRSHQADLARRYGIEAFCYYHYWFSGKRLLERPFNEVLESGEPDFPFCLCWANETWKGHWYGASGRTLVEQSYPGEDDHRRHFDYLCQAFYDDRYLRVDEKPLFLFYRPNNIPEIERFVDLWQTLAIRSGLNGLYLVGIQQRVNEWLPQAHGMDGSITIQLPRTVSTSWSRPVEKIRHFLRRKSGRPRVYRYKDVYLDLLHTQIPHDEHYPCVIPNWDNTARSGPDGLVLHDSTPELAGIQLRNAIQMMEKVPADRRMIFVKSWNEWAEGNYLEPDQRDGHAYLEAYARELFRSQSSQREQSNHLIASSA